MKFTCLGDKNRITVKGNVSSTNRQPYPFIDVTGSPVIIGEEPVISSGVYIHTHTHQFNKKKWINMPPSYDETPLIIGDFVFIGVNAQIMHTCKNIGDYSVVAAGAIVTKDIPSCEIWGGNPARKIGEVE